MPTIRIAQDAVAGEPLGRDRLRRSCPGA